MGIFTLTQNLVEQNLYLYPNGDLSTCTEFAAVGNSPNFACVDDNRLLPNEDIDYVWWANLALGLDLYELPNTAETGVINYVQVYARAKSHNTPQKADGIYKIICSPDSVCGNVHESADINLVTNYTTYSKVWKKNPDDDNDWEWPDVNAMSIGAKCNSPGIADTLHYMTIRPNGVGDVTQLSANRAQNWWCVDDTSPNDSDWVYGTAWDYDLYALQDHTTQTGDITNVAVFIACKSFNQADRFKEKIKTNGVVYTGPTIHWPGYGSWETFSYSWADNPQTGSAWTWSEIDALQAGVTIDSTSTEGQCTQVYVVVTYKEPISPEIRTTQCYAKINYTVDELVCRLNKPKGISTNHARNTKMLNFWDGSREVYDLNRSGKSMVLTGMEIDVGNDESTWCDNTYAFRKKITIDHDQVDGNLSNFPVYINTNLNKKCLNANGYDVMLCDSSCSEYKCDIEHYDSGTGDMKLWVKIPTLSSTVDTVLWIYYRKTGVTINPSTTEVWDDAGFSTVFHMTDEDITRDTIKDSTDAVIVGTKGGANEPSEANARLHKGQKADGINDVIEVPNHADLNMQQGNFTFSLWMKSPASQGAARDIICKNKDAGTAWFLLRQGSSSDSDRIWFYNYQDGTNYHRTLTLSVCDGNWHLFHFVVDYSEAGDDRLVAYVDGVLNKDADVFLGNPNITSVDNVRMLRGTLSGTGGYWEGELDEVRWAKGQSRSAIWCDAEWNNQKAGSTFITYGTQQERYVSIVNASDRLMCVRSMARNGEIIDINELNPSYFNGNYRIRSFGWKKINEKPENYDWILELESAE